MFTDFVFYLPETQFYAFLTQIMRQNYALCTKDLIMCYTVDNAMFCAIALLCSPDRKERFVVCESTETNNTTSNSYLLMCCHVLIKWIAYVTHTSITLKSIYIYVHFRFKYDSAVQIVNFIFEPNEIVILGKKILNQMNLPVKKYETRFSFLKGTNKKQKR